MPFDPNLPAPNSPLQSLVIRDQLQALYALIQNIVTVGAAEIDAVNTLPAGSAAIADVSVNGGTLHFTFGLPQGNNGAEGPPFAQAVVDAVDTGAPGSAAAVGVSYDGSMVRFTFSIPQGNEGPQGAQGQPGEVSQSDLNNGLMNTLSQTSNNTNGVGTLTQAADGSYNASQMQDVMNKLDELINALRR